MSRFRMAVVGVGALGRHHARLLSEMEDVQLVGVADPNEQQGQAVAKAHGTRWVADYKELLSKVDGLSIVVPTFLHRRIAEEALSRGIPVLVEKPITGTIADAQALCNLADDQAIPLQVGHIERFNPAFLELATRVERPRYLRAERLSPYAFRSTDISAVLDLMIHDLDLILTLVQAPIRRVEAFGVCVVGGLVDIVQARVLFENGSIADLTANRVSPTVSRTLQVWSETGCVTADLQAQTVTAIQPGADLLAGQLPLELAQQPGADIEQLKSEMFTRFLQQQQPTIAPTNALHDELRNFIDSVRTGGSPKVNGRDGLAALSLAKQIESAVESHAWDGHPQGLIGPHAHHPQSTQRSNNNTRAA
ncbi:MAG: Gfo/Idh/MocA family oxidoreductase [Planctomycetaceae bacterium]